MASIELAELGPQAPIGRVPSLAEAREYCRRMARAQYENFTVASWLLPRALRQHFYAVYAYCRWADDLADETGSSEQSLALLDWWEGQLHDCYRGTARHPVFVALAETVREFDIPQSSFADLLIAFRQDQSVTRYDTVEQLLEYCRYSANPVGRIVLALGRSHDEPRGRLADTICTGLQWINHCQDVARDWQRGRVYLPRNSWQAAGYDEAMLARNEFNAAFRAAIAGEVDRAESFLQAGWSLVECVTPELRLDVALFIEGGLAIARAIRAIDYNVWARPTTPRWRKAALVARSWLRVRRRAKQEGRA